MGLYVCIETLDRLLMVHTYTTELSQDALNVYAWSSGDRVWLILKEFGPPFRDPLHFLGVI